MTGCAVKLCHNKSDKHKKCYNITFHRIPTEPNIAVKWIKNIRLSRNEEYWKPSKNTRICSEHFNNEDQYFTEGGLRRLHRNAVPVMNLHISCKAEHSNNDSNIDNTAPSHEPPLMILNVAQNTEEIVGESSNNVVIANLPQSSTSHGNFTCSSADESLHDTPHEFFLRQRLMKSTLLNLKYRKIIKTLRQKNRRLEEKNESLKRILGGLRKKGFVNKDKSNERFISNDELSTVIYLQ